MVKIAAQEVSTKMVLSIVSLISNQTSDVCALELAGSHLGVISGDQKKLREELSTKLKQQYNIGALAEARKSVAGEFEEMTKQSVATEEVNDALNKLREEKQKEYGAHEGREAVTLKYELDLIEAVQQTINNDTRAADKTIAQMIAEANTNPMPDDYRRP